MIFVWNIIQTLLVTQILHVSFYFCIVILCILFCRIDSVFCLDSWKNIYIFGVNFSKIGFFIVKVSYIPTPSVAQLIHISMLATTQWVPSHSHSSSHQPPATSHQSVRQSIAILLSLSCSKGRQNLIISRGNLVINMGGSWNRHGTIYYLIS